MMGVETLRFTAIRSVKLLFRYFLEIIDELRVEGENNNKNLKVTFDELEGFLKKEYGIAVSLQPFLKYSNIVNEEKSKQIRKRILDYGNHLIREIETQK